MTDALADELERLAKEATNFSLTMVQRGVARCAFLDLIDENLPTILSALRERERAPRCRREATGPNGHRYHLTEPTITLSTVDGEETFGEGWLLISEAEYATLREREREPVAWCWEVYDTLTGYSCQQLGFSPPTPIKYQKIRNLKPLFTPTQQELDKPND